MEEEEEEKEEEIEEKAENKKKTKKVQRTESNLKRFIVIFGTLISQDHVIDLPN